MVSALSGRVAAVRWCWAGLGIAVALSACASPSTTQPTGEAPNSSRPTLTTQLTVAPESESPSTTYPTRTDETQPSAGPGALPRALRLLSQLKVVDRVPPDTYDRDAFGSDWADTDGNGCNQRDDVRLRDAVAGTATTTAQGSCGSPRIVEVVS